MLIQGRIRKVVCDRQGVIINYGRTRRLFTGRQRQAVLLQAARCNWPGCHAPHRQLQADHVTPWAAQNGETNITNSNALCGWHNRLKQHGYTTHRDPHGHWHHYRPDGTEIT